MEYDQQAAVLEDLVASVHRYARVKYPQSRDMGNFEYMVDVLARTMIPATIDGFAKHFEDFSAALYAEMTRSPKIPFTEEELRKLKKGF